MRGGDRGDDGQPEAGALGAARVKPGEAFEDSVPLVRRDARPVVGDAELKAIAGDGRADLDRRAWRGVRDSVRGQLHDRLGDALRVQDSSAGGGAGQGEPVLVGAVERADLDGHRPCQGGDVDGLGAQEVGPLAPGQQRELIDQAGSSWLARRQRSPESGHHHPLSP